MIKEQTAICKLTKTFRTQNALEKKQETAEAKNIIKKYIFSVFCFEQQPIVAT